MSVPYPPPDGSNWAGVSVEEALAEQTRRLNAFKDANELQQKANDWLRSEWDRIRAHNIKLENYLCECISLLAQHDIAPPDPSDERVKAVLQEKFINAIKGN